MSIAECEELIQIEAEQMSEALFEVSYCELPPDLKVSVRARTIAVLWPDQIEPQLVAAA